jgi:EAL domain-containing protein (putative c-di-GMP-specific phosphodiesterase class I)
MDERIRLRRVLALDLHALIVRNEFEAHYQPLIKLATDRITAFEGLLRWLHPVRGRILPSEFIPVAEKTGTIVTMGEWVSRTASFETRKWPADSKVAVNLSPIQFRKGSLLANGHLGAGRIGAAAGQVRAENHGIGSAAGPTQHPRHAASAPRHGDSHRAG